MQLTVYRDLNYNVMDNETVIYMLQQERVRPFSDMKLYIEYLTKGVDFYFAQIPTNDKTALLLEDLKKGGFVSSDTNIEHFRVLFGVPLHKSRTPFEPIKWRKNKQLLRAFIYTLFPKETIWYAGLFAIPSLFADKNGTAIYLPQSDKKRLEQSSDYNTLKELLKKFNE